MFTLLRRLLLLFSRVRVFVHSVPFLLPIAIVFDVITGLFFVRNIARYYHRKREYAKGDLVHLRVTLPRNDSKMDNDKRTEKDFHEQIGKAEQFFRALHETGDLNLYNKLVKGFLWGKPHFSFELQFEGRELRFVVVTDEYYREILQKQITSFYPAADIEIVKPEKRFELKPEGYTVNGYYMHTKDDFWYPIQTYKQIEDDPLNNLSNSFSKLTEDEKGVIQFIVHPVQNATWQDKAKAEGTRMFKGKTKKGFHIPIITPIFNMILWPIRVLFTGYDPTRDGGTNAPGASSGDSYVRMLASEEEIAKAVGEKANQPGYEVTVRVLASTKKGHARVNEMLNGMFVSFNAFSAKGMNRFENRRILPFDGMNGKILYHNFKYRLPRFMEKISIMSTDEVATMFHFPDARYNPIPTIKWLDYKVLPPPIHLPKEGVILGKSVYRGVEKFVRIMRDDRTRHMYVLGKSGSGKSVLLWNMAVQDVENNEGVCVIDPHGDLVEDIVACAPKHRAKDIVLFDPADIQRPMGLNILEANTSEEKDRASLDAMEIMIKLFGNEIFGPRIQHYFRNGCLTLMDDTEESATLIDVPRLFIDDDYQRYKVSKIQNPMVRAFWENEMAQTGDREKQEMIPYFTSKFGPFVTNTTMRNVIGQTKSAFNIRQIMDTQKVLMVNLSKGKIGAINAQLLGLIMVSKINQAAMGRADMPKEERKDFYLYVDEFQNFATDTFASILSEARKYRLNLIMAHQYIAQLSESAGGVAVGQKDSKIRDAVFGNVGSMLSFKVGADDAEYLEKEYAPDLSQQDILSMANYKAYIKLNINNATSRPFSIETLYDPSKRSAKVLEVLKKYSRMKYGRKKEFVDAEIEARMGITNVTGEGDSALETVEKLPDAPAVPPTPAASPLLGSMPKPVAQVPVAAATPKPPAPVA